MGQMTRMLDNYVAGALMGLIGPFIGYGIWGSYQTYFNDRASSLVGFSKMILNNQDAWSGVIALALLANLGLLFISLRFETMKGARGILGATIVYAYLAVYFKFFL